MPINKNAFTLVELIVVVTILWILATIWFVSYSGYLTGVRDTNRISSLTSISDGLELYRTRRDLPLPDTSVRVLHSGSTVAYQWYAGTNVLQTIEYSKSWRDPKYDFYFTYYLASNKKSYQLMAFLEESEHLDITYIWNTTHAIGDYSNLYPKVYGKRLWLLTQQDNTPLQEVASIKTAWVIDLSTNTDIYRANFTDQGKLEAPANELSVLKDLVRTGWKANNCLTWLLQNPELKWQDGIFTLTDTTGRSYNGFCDQSSNEGGYTQLPTANPGNNFILNGDFATGDINTESGSHPSNTIVDIVSPINSGKAMHQTGANNSEYEIHFPNGTTLLQWDIIRMSAWVHGTDGDDYIFHNRVTYTTGSPTINGTLKTLQTRIVDGRTWKLQEVKHELLRDGATSGVPFNWYIWYGAQGSSTNFYFTGVKLEILRK